MFPRFVGLCFAVGCMLVFGVTTMAEDEKPGRAGAQTDGPGVKAAPKKQTELQKLVGTWLAVSAEHKGAKLADADLKDLVSELVFTPDQTVTRRATGSVTTCKITIGPHRTPREIDFQKAPWKAIYELEGDTLKLCISYTHTAVLNGYRPMSMDGKDPNGLLIVFKRKPAPLPKDDKDGKAKSDGMEVRSFVTGYVVKVACKSGSEVKKGDALVQIDPRPYAAQLDAAQAIVEQKRAAQIHAEATSKQFKELAQKQAGAVGEAELARYQAQERQAKAALALAEANRELAKLDLDSTTVRAPMDGQIGRVLVSAGGLVAADKTAVAIIIQVKK